ncbi:uncharacterized protein LOC131683224 isoform X2 [Topomyia yanbarensis]|uniref:uncharacterized protein LOC131683224 isoform X2 n=1 Tax=Topomyia yanbarensis TaxID=2498891 RepID=UPI00273CD7E0|nr:uncharacterized protein LOC131683224 isoform X2 [Topomyia yanbarensis]
MKTSGDGEHRQLPFTGADQRTEMDCDSQTARTSPPKSIIDCSPLQAAMDKNKESLKVKLLVRRTMNQLVEQGIMPSLKTSPAIYEQQRQLERAKTGDLLKAKIKQRPNRMELERRHILEHQEGKIDPSLAEKKRMLEKALLVDHLNSKISHRPGPLELIEKNILHAEEPIERIVKEGLVNFTCTDEAVSPAQALLSPERMTCVEDDSLSSEGETQSLQKIAPINVLFLAQNQNTSIPAKNFTATSIVRIEKQPSSDSITSNNCITFLQPENSVKVESVLETCKKTSSGSMKNDTREKSKKKCKHKAISKARSIKFHEYKGPPNAQKHSAVQPNSGETNYQLIMKQQYLLEYLEEICKDPPVLPVSSKMSFSATVKEKEPGSSIQRNDSNSTQKIPPDPATEVLNKLKVFQLKRYCKKYNLPVSGSKSSLVDRLKPFLYLMEKSPDFDGKTDIDVLGSCNAHDQKSNDGIEENLLKEQQKRIAELQKQLKKSQDELELIKLNQMRSHQDFIIKQQNHVSAAPMQTKSEPSHQDRYKNKEINITSMHADKMLSDMDIKISVRIEPDSSDTEIKPKMEPNYVENEMILNMIDAQHDMLGRDDLCRATWKTNNTMQSMGDVIQCDSSLRENASYVSNKETLDKLLGQVQPGIPSLNDGKSDHSYKPADTGSCRKNSPLGKHLSKTSLDENLHTPLGLNDYNDVDLLDFHMHIDDTCDEFTVTKPEENSVPFQQPNSDMLTDSNTTVRMDEKNIFNNFDGLRFVHSVPYSNIFTTYRSSINTEIPGETKASKMFSKTENLNDINKNYSTTILNDANRLLRPSQRDVEHLSHPGISNIKRDWTSDGTSFANNKFKPIHPDGLQQNVQTSLIRSEILNIADDKCNDIRFSYDDSAKSTISALSGNLNNNAISGHASPMDFDSLLSNIDLPNPNCDRGLLDGNQEKTLYDLQQSSLLDYFNDDYGMQNDSLTCEINNTSY